MDQFPFPVAASLTEWELVPLFLCVFPGFVLGHSLMLSGCACQLCWSGPASTQPAPHLCPTPAPCLLPVALSWVCTDCAFCPPSDSSAALSSVSQHCLLPEGVLGCPVSSLFQHHGQRSFAGTGAVMELTCTLPLTHRVSNDLKVIAQSHKVPCSFSTREPGLSL